MASSWFQAPDDSYVNAARLERVWVAQRADGTWTILGSLSGDQVALDAGFATQQAAQTKLDSYVALIGGAV